MRLSKFTFGVLRRQQDLESQDSVPAGPAIPDPLHALWQSLKHIIDNVNGINTI